MRLINVRTLELRTFGDNPPKYAILSQRWGDGELSFQDFQDPTKHVGAGFQKVSDFCRLIRHASNPPSFRAYDGIAPIELEWAWVDTVCIDKTSSSELSEAINSMWKYYAKAAYCVAYLSDVTKCGDLHEIYKSQWFKRGWTLQELLAPWTVIFYTKSWERLGAKIETKSGFSGVIATASGVRRSFLKHEDPRDASIAQRMSWAARRETTRGEDIAYCLLGLFDVNMPLLYGEGAGKAFARLQKEVIQQSTNESIFASRSPTNARGVLADSPRAFRDSGNVCAQDRVARPPYAITHKGLQFEGPAIKIVSGDWRGGYVLKLNCIRSRHQRLCEDDRKVAVGCVLCLVPSGDQQFVRDAALEAEVEGLPAKTVRQMLKDGLWETVDHERFFVALTTPKFMPEWREDAMAVHNFKDDARYECLDEEGPWFMGLKKVHHSKERRSPSRVSTRD